MINTHPFGRIFWFLLNQIYLAVLEGRIGQDFTITFTLENELDFKIQNEKENEKEFIEDILKRARDLLPPSFSSIKERGYFFYSLNFNILHFLRPLLGALVVRSGEAKISSIKGVKGVKGKCILEVIRETKERVFEDSDKGCESYRRKFYEEIQRYKEIIEKKEEEIWNHLSLLFCSFWVHYPQAGRTLLESIKQEEGQSYKEFREKIIKSAKILVETTSPQTPFFFIDPRPRKFCEIKDKTLFGLGKEGDWIKGVLFNKIGDIREEVSLCV